MCLYSLALIVYIAVKEHTRINAMQVVQVRSEAQSLDGAFNVLLDMRGGVGDGSLAGKDVEATLGSNFIN